MSAATPHQADSTSALAPVVPQLETVAKRLGVKSVLVMRSAPDSMVVAATAGEAAKHYTVGAAGAKAGADAEKVPLYCERVVNTDDTLFVCDSRIDPTFAGNEDEAEFGLYNHFGVAVHDSVGNVVGTVCVLDDTARDYTADQRRELEQLRADVEAIVQTCHDALG
jgi:GAF domain-containing protein